LANDNETSKVFYDIHCHAFNLTHPSLFAFLENLRKTEPGDFLKEVFTIRDFLPTHSLTMTRQNIMNLLAVMESDIGGMFVLMADDLAGKFRKDDSVPFLKDGILSIGGTQYDRIVLTPLIMDFNTPSTTASDIYYNRPPVKSIQKQVDDMLDGIRFFLQERPKSIVEIYPFIGINPANYAYDEIEKLLKKYLGLHAGSRKIFSKVFTALSRLDIADRISARGLFAGLKLYPPLGFDPWPEGNDEEMRKVNAIYDYCQSNNIPITTHCDDQGYRTIPSDDAYQWTSPSRWRKVLEHYPELKLNFAHFGRQYKRKFGIIQEMTWFNEIINLCCEYEGVFTDFSFTATDPDFYDFLLKMFDTIPTYQFDGMQRKIMFGSDFMIHLMDVPSYYDYFKIFHESPLTQEQKHAFGSTNPERFLFNNVDIIKSRYEVKK
jgi:hypothetical protein